MIAACVTRCLVAYTCTSLVVGTGIPTFINILMFYSCFTGFSLHFPYKYMQASPAPFTAHAHVKPHMHNYKKMAFKYTDKLAWFTCLETVLLRFCHQKALYMGKKLFGIRLYKNCY